MPELSRPLIAILGVVISVAVLFIAVAGFLPFFQQSVSSTTQQASFSATVTASTVKSGTTINSILFTVNVQKLVGSGTYYITQSDVKVYAPNGTLITTAISYIPSSTTLATFTSDTNSQGFTIKVDDSSTGTWVIVISVTDSSGNPVQTMSVSVDVA